MIRYWLQQLNAKLKKTNKIKKIKTNTRCTIQSYILQVSDSYQRYILQSDYFCFCNWKGAEISILLFKKNTFKALKSYWV